MVRTTHPLWTIKFITFGFAAMVFIFLLPPVYDRVATTKAEVEAFEEEVGSMEKSIVRNDTAIMSKHFFDCDHEDSLCSYFQTKVFFKTQGTDFSKDATAGATNPNLPALTGFSARSPLPAKYSYLPSTLFTFVHVHKCGGTSVKATLSQLAKKVPVGAVTQYKYSFGGGSAQMKERNEQKRLEYIESLVKKKDRNILFTVVRDPVDRFLSAVQQVMHYNDELRDKCLIPSSAKRTIQCAIDDAREHNFRGDVHLLPMVSHFRLLAEQSIAVFELKTALPFLLQQLGSRGKRHARDRTQEEYATSKVLSTMSINDCTAEMVLAICELYAIDVAFMKHLGFDTPNCV
jgi:hypothetical protein